MTYMVCEKCGGYYQLQEGESPDDFDLCQCGGKLEYKESMGNIEPPQNVEDVTNSPSENEKGELNSPVFPDQIETSKNPEKRKNPWLAALLSLILPGLGHIYAGNYFKGFAGISFLIFWVLREFFYPPPYPWPAFVPGAVELVIYSSFALDAARTAINANKINSGTETPNPDILLCPECGAENVKKSDSCISCGRDLRNTLFYVNGGNSINHTSDIEITLNSMVEYEKRFYGARSGKITEYSLDEVGDILISDRYQKWTSPFPFPYMNVDFDYGNRRKSVYIPETVIFSFMETLDSLDVPYENSLFGIF
jgi:hypothetical protein